MVQLHSPEFGSVVHDAPVSVQDPLEGLVPCGAVDSCTTDPNADAPVNVRVWLEVMLSVVEMPESDESMRFGSDVAGNAYRTMTSPDPPVPPALEDATAERDGWCKCVVGDAGSSACGVGVACRIAEHAGSY